MGVTLKSPKLPGYDIVTCQSHKSELRALCNPVLVQIEDHRRKFLDNNEDFEFHLDKKGIKLKPYKRSGKTEYFQYINIKRITKSKPKNDFSLLKIELLTDGVFNIYFDPDTREMIDAFDKVHPIWTKFETTEIAEPSLSAGDRVEAVKKSSTGLFGIGRTYSKGNKGTVKSVDPSTQKVCVTWDHGKCAETDA